MGMIGAEMPPAVSRMLYADAVRLTAVDNMSYYRPKELERAKHLTCTNVAEFKRPIYDVRSRKDVEQYVIQWTTVNKKGDSITSELAYNIDETITRRCDYRHANSEPCWHWRAFIEYCLAQKWVVIDQADVKKVLGK